MCENHPNFNEYLQILATVPPINTLSLHRKFVNLSFPTDRTTTQPPATHVIIEIINDVNCSLYRTKIHVTCHKKSSEYTMNAHITSYFYLFCYLSNLWNEKFYLMRLINMKFTLCFVFLMGFYLNFLDFFLLHFYVCNYPFKFNKTFFLIFCNEYGYLISKLIYFGNCLSFVLILIIKSKMGKLPNQQLSNLTEL